MFSVSALFQASHVFLSMMTLKLQGPRGLTPMGQSGQAPGAPRPPGNATASLTRKEGDRPHLEPSPSVLPATAGAEASGVAGRAPATRPSPP